MKLVKVLDQEGTNLVADAVNQIILKELVKSEKSISDLASTLSLPKLKLWRKMQKLSKAGLVEVTKTEKVGNIEKKLYRSTATWFAPKQYFDFKPKNPSLKKAFAIYSDIQKNLMLQASTFGDIPQNADPIDFSLYVNMQAFAVVCGKPSIQKKIAELSMKLEHFQLESVLPGK
jgi:hypothetical protein